MLQEDCILIERAQKNKEDFGLLYAKYKGAVFAYLLKRIDFDRETAEDLMSETFLRALEHFPSFTPTGNSYLSYLLTIAHNILVNHYRTKKPVPFNECDDISVDSEELVERAETHFEAEQVTHAMHALEPAGERLLSLRYEEGMSIKYIAHVTHKTPNAIKLALCRGRRKLVCDPFVASIKKDHDQHRHGRARQLVLVPLRQ